MCSVEDFRGFVCERLTAAAEEIFGVFKRTIVEYEEEIDRQRRLLDIVWKPEVKLHRIELPQQHVWKMEEEEVVSDQQLCDQQRNSSLDQEDLKPPGIKQEQDELCTSQEGELLEMKLDSDTVTWTSPYEGGDHSEPETQNDRELLSDNSDEAEDQDQKKRQHGHSGSTRDPEAKPKGRRRKRRSHSSDPNLSDTDKKAFKCVTCGKTFRCNYNLNTHLRTHTGEKPYSCKTCGKRFIQISHLSYHMKTHTDERPYPCKTCGKRYKDVWVLKKHMRIHTGERPYTCNTCGRSFTDGSNLYTHIRTHSGERPYSCDICGNRYSKRSNLNAHKRKRNCNLAKHMG